MNWKHRSSASQCWKSRPSTGRNRSRHCKSSQPGTARRARCLLLLSVWRVGKKRAACAHGAGRSREGNLVIRATPCSCMRSQPRVSLLHAYERSALPREGERDHSREYRNRQGIDIPTPPPLVVIPDEDQGKRCPQCQGSTAAPFLRTCVPQCQTGSVCQAWQWL